MVSLYSRSGDVNVRRDGKGNRTSMNEGVMIRNTSIHNRGDRNCSLGTSEQHSTRSVSPIA